MMDKLEKQVIAALQNDMPLVSRPFAAIAERLGVEESEVLRIVKRLRREKKLRRIAAVLLHRRAGFRANGLTMWKVPGEDCDRIGRRIAAFQCVTHCYRRRPFRGWPYTLYAMVHARTRAECRAAARRISEAVGIEDYEILFSTAELKKTSPTYFEEI